jgi:hypothetical protein
VSSTSMKKLDPHSQKCIFVGYTDSDSGTDKVWNFRNTSAKMLIQSKHAIVCENKRFMDLGGAPPEYPDAKLEFYPPITEDSEEHERKLQAEQRLKQRDEQRVEQHVDLRLDHDRQPVALVNDNFIPGEFPQSPEQAPDPPVQLPLPPKRQPGIVYGPADPDAPAMSTRSRSHVASAQAASPADPVGEELNLHVYAFHVTTLTTICKARASPQVKEWGEAYQKEMHRFLQNETGQIVEFPGGAHEFDGRWLQKLKCSMADIQHFTPIFKARYIVQGHTQIYGTD